MTTFMVTFHGSAPDPVTVGDVLEVWGKATVQAIRADLVDITSYGTNETTFTLGEVDINLYANTMKVRKP